MKVDSVALQAARDLMLGFAERSGIHAADGGRRYLWTDAYAVCNFLGLADTLDDDFLRQEALALIDAVHRTLGRHRPDDVRTGWLSGLSEREGAAHPTAGGLRIGKPLPEPAPGAPAEPALEWDRDGQYFHYLTRWMHALDQASRATGRSDLNRWARELVVTAFRAFSYEPRPGAPRRMYWKMSVDLERPLVASMGHLDPLDGYVTCLQLENSAREQPAAPAGPSLDSEIEGFAAMVAGRDWVTDDPLGLGGLLTDAYRLAQIDRGGAHGGQDLIATLLADAGSGFEQLLLHPPWRLPATQRLGFRELGLALGLRAVTALQNRAESGPDRQTLGVLAPLIAPLIARSNLSAQLTEFWSMADHQRSPGWTGHRDISEVMLATVLAPSGYLEMAPAS